MRRMGDRKRRRMRRMIYKAQLYRCAGCRLLIREQDGGA